MTIEQLVKELTSPVYKNMDDKIKRAKKYLKTDYLDYELKMAITENILLASRYIEVKGKKVYSPNGPVEYKCKIIALVEMYYDIKFDSEGEKQLEEFNLLEKNNLSEILINAIGEDIKRFDAVYNMMASDIAYKESLIPWLSTKFESMSMVINQLTDVMEHYKSTFNDKVENVNSIIEK